MLGVNEKKRRELSRYLDIDETDILIEDEDSSDKYNEYYCSDGIYLVMDEEESTDAVRNDIENSLYDLGIEAFTLTFQEKILDNYIDDKYFSEICENNYKLYAEDIETEQGQDYANRLIDECVEHKLIDTDDIDSDGNYTGDDDLQELLAEYLYDEVERSYSSFASWFQFDFGNDMFRQEIRNGNVDFDIDGIVDECIEADGFGHFISHYDGKTVELDTFFAYKMDDGDYSKGR